MNMTTDITLMPVNVGDWVHLIERCAEWVEVEDEDDYDDEHAVPVHAGTRPCCPGWHEPCYRIVEADRNGIVLRVTDGTDSAAFFWFLDETFDDGTPRFAVRIADREEGT